MSWFHKTNKVYIDASPTSMKSLFPAETFVDVGGQALSNANWIFDPSFPAGVPATIPYKYLNVSGEVITEMSVGEKAAVDAAGAAALLTAQRLEAETRADIDFTTRSTVAETEQEVQKLRVRVQEVMDALTAIKATSGGSDNIRAAIPAGNTSSGAAPATFSNISDRLVSQWLTDIIARINAGGADP